MSEEPAEHHRSLGAPRLRPRLVLTFALVAAVSSVALAVTSYALVRRATLDRARASALRESRASLEDAADRLSPSPTGGQLEDFTARLKTRAGFDVVAFGADGASQTTSISLSAASVPAALQGPVASGRVAVTRVSVAGSPYHVVGGRILPDGPSFYFFFPLEEVDADLTLLRNVLAGVGGGLVALSALVGAVAARGVLRPLRRALHAVHRVEAGELETRLPEAGRDEFADLSRSFNRMAEALQRTVGELRALEDSHRRFVSDVSHELRTPLTALTTAAGVLEVNVDGLNDPGRRAARLLVVESRRLGALVEDLMEISRLDAGAAAMAWEPVDLAVAVEGALAARGCEDRVEAHLAGGATTFADRRRLDSIVGNLVGNALEHARPPVHVTVSATPDDVILEVTDSGGGIPPEHLHHVFERFYKGDPSRPRSAGSGLGLAIARENARLHGGDLTVTSHPGAGTTFTVTLPRRSPPADDIDGPEDAPPRR